MFENHPGHLIWDWRNEPHCSSYFIIVSDAKHRANDDTSIFHVEKTIFLFLSTDSRSLNEERRREKEREKKMTFTVEKLPLPIDIAPRTEEIDWSSSVRKLSESRVHNYKHSVKRVPCSRTFVFFECTDSTILQKGNYSCLTVAAHQALP